MTTVIAVYGSEGCVGRCDAKCHDATKPDCGCICGGRLHGIGSSRALERSTRDVLGVELADTLRAFAARRELDEAELRVAFAEVQLELEVRP